MSNISKNTEIKFLLNNQQFNAPIEWEELEIEANYENGAVQPNLVIEEFQFPLEARQAILQWIRNGLTGGVGIFEGMSFQMTLFNNQSTQENFISYLDFTNGYKDLLEDQRVNVSLIKKDGLDSFEEKLAATTYGYLEAIGEITNSDYVNIDYVVEKKFNLIEILVTNIILYLLVKELAQSIRNTSDAISDVAALFANPFGGQVSAIVRAVAIALINVIYTAVILIAIIDLAQNFINTLVPPQRKHKAMTLRALLEKAANHFGYQFQSPIAELNTLHYLPSNPNLDEKTALGFISVTKGTQKGIPNTLDYGYTCAEMFELAKRLFNAQIAIVNGVLHLRSENDVWWRNQSNYQLPNVRIEAVEYNTDELVGNRLISFQTDLNDEWTIDNFGGTAYEIRTTQITTINKEAVLIKGLEEINLNVALGNRKDNLNPLENLLKVVAQTIDNVTGIFGGGTNFKSLITDRLGMLKQSNNWHSLPKLLYLTGGKLPTNHRQLFNCKVLYDKYHNYRSFVRNNYGFQKVYYKNVTIPFGFEDYKQLTNNGYFYYNGKVAKMISWNWKPAQDKATASFFVFEVYTKNLKEIYINPS